MSSTYARFFALVERYPGHPRAGKQRVDVKHPLSAPAGPIVNSSDVFVECEHEGKKKPRFLLPSSLYHNVKVEEGE